MEHTWTGWGGQTGPWRTQWTLRISPSAICAQHFNCIYFHNATISHRDLSEKFNQKRTFHTFFVRTELSYFLYESFVFSKTLCTSEENFHFGAFPRVFPHASIIWLCPKNESPGQTLSNTRWRKSCLFFPILLCAFSVFVVECVKIDSQSVVCCMYL